MQDDKRYVFAHSTPYPGIARVYEMPLQIDRPGVRSGVEYRAIWDTGATGTCVSRRLAEFLGLPADGYINNSTANGTAVCPLITVDVRFNSGLCFEKIQVCVVDMINVDCLIGTDIISRGDFIVTNSNGKTLVTFGVPSIKKINLVDEARKMQVISSKTPGKKDVCPCNSGKKYKDCCGKYN